MGKIITVQVRLLEEGTEVSRPTQALSLREGLYKILPTPNYDPNDEIWQFPPGSIIRILEKTDNGKSYFIACDKNAKNKI